MAHNQPITLKIVDPDDFSGIYRAFAVLLMFYPDIARKLARKLAFTRQRRASSLVLYPTGNISLRENGLPSSSGSLGMQHWLTQRLSVLGVVIGGKTHRLVLLANQQNADDYRRLQVWMQHRFAVKDE